MKVDVHLGAIASVRMQSGSTGRVLYYHRDHLGSVVATSKGGGLAGASYRYGPWGDLRVTQGDTGDAASERGFADSIRLSGTLLVMGVRVYDTQLRQFLQPDPIDPMTYTYVGGDPVNLVDPSGMTEKPTHHCVGECNDLNWAGWRSSTGWFSGYGSVTWVNPPSYPTRAIDGSIGWNGSQWTARDGSSIMTIRTANEYEIYFERLGPAGVEAYLYNLHKLSGPALRSWYDFLARVPIADFVRGEGGGGGGAERSRGSSHVAIEVAEVVAHGAVHVASKELPRAAVALIATEVVAGLSTGLSESGALMIESVWAGAGGMILAEFATGALAGVGVIVEVKIHDALVQSTANDIFAVLSRGRGE